MDPYLNPAYCLMTRLPGGFLFQVRPRQPTLHRAETQLPGPPTSFHRPSLSVTTAEATPAIHLCAAYLPPTIFNTMASTKPAADTSPPPANKPSAKSAPWSTQTEPPQLTQASLDLSPLDNILPLRLFLSPGANYRRNCLSRRRFRKLRKIANLQLSPPVLRFRAALLAPASKLPSSLLPIKRRPLLPPEKVTLTTQTLLTMTN